MTRQTIVSSIIFGGVAGVAVFLFMNSSEPFESRLLTGSVIALAAGGGNFVARLGREKREREAAEAARIAKKRKKKGGAANADAAPQQIKPEAASTDGGAALADNEKPGGGKLKP